MIIIDIMHLITMKYYIQKYKWNITYSKSISYNTYKVFTENKRVVSLLKTANFNEVYQIEVGALNIGKIHNHNKKNLKKYEEKGYFSFGGSTIVLLFEKSSIKIDKDILENSKNNLETKVSYGEVIGKNIDYLK